VLWAIAQQQALESLGQTQDVPIYVCKACGYTTTKLPERNCPSCRESVSEYEKIN
jgi:rubrerythrin